MLRLRALGSPCLEGAGGTGAAGQRKPLALLALLAEAGPAGVSRDRVAAYHWPEADARKASHRLNQLLHSLRRDLDCSDVFLKGSDLKLNLQRITNDVGEFRADRRSTAALAAGTLDAREIGSRLGAVAILEGTLRWAGDRVRVTVQLVSTADGCFRWSERYDREVMDPFAAQDALTAEIVGALRAPLDGLERE